VDSRAGLDDVENRKFRIQPSLELRPLGRLARSQLLYRLLYPGPYEAFDKKLFRKEIFNENGNNRE
jgi:hypothetical protein